MAGKEIRQTVEIARLRTATFNLAVSLIFPFVLWILQSFITLNSNLYSVTPLNSSKIFSIYSTSGAYKSLVDLSLDPNSPEYIPTLVYQARSHIALNNPKAALQLIPTGSENVALKAVVALAKFVDAEDADREALLEELRDLSLEIDSDDVEGTERDKATVRVLAGTAFARAGELEEALETLGADTEDLEAYVSSFLRATSTLK